MAPTKRPLLLTVREVSKLLRIHRPKVYDLIKEGSIEGFKIGADWRIKRESVEAMIGPIPDDFFTAAANSKNGYHEEEAETLPL